MRAVLLSLVVWSALPAVASAQLTAQIAIDRGAVVRIGAGAAGVGPRVVTAEPVRVVPILPIVIVPTVSQDCLWVEVMATLSSIARLEGPDALAVQRDLATAVPLICGTDYFVLERWPGSGERTTTLAGHPLYPNGQRATTLPGTIYYPDGSPARSATGTWYYPDGTLARRRGGTWYTPDGRRLGRMTTTHADVRGTATILARFWGAHHAI